MKTLKELQSRRKSIIEQLKIAETDLKNIKLDIQKLNLQIQEIDGLIEKKTKEITVSEHAILRFAERYLDLDVENIRAMILSEKLLTSSVGFSSGKFPIGDEMGTAVLKDNVIVTVT